MAGASLESITEKCLAIFKKNWLLLYFAAIIGTYLPIILVACLFASLGSLFHLPPPNFEAKTVDAQANNVIYVICALPPSFLLCTLTKLGWTAICLKLTQNISTGFVEFKNNFVYYWPTLVVSIIAGLAVSIGLLLLFLPGIYLSIRFAFTPMLVMDKKLKPKEALSLSWKMTRDSFWKIFFWSLAAFLFRLVANIIPYAGIIIAPAADAFVDLFLICIYREQDNFDSNESIA